VIVYNRIGRKRASIDRIAIIGGTGPLGRGLATRLALAGCAVVVGSRDGGRARTAADAVSAATGSTRVSGRANAEAIAEVDATVLAIAAEGLDETLACLRDPLAGRLVIDAVVPLAMRDGLVEHAPPPGAASAGELIQRRLPTSRVVAAFNNAPAAALLRTEEPLAGDVIVCGDDPAARAEVATLVERLVALRAVDAGPMRLVRAVEGITALLVNLNRRHRAHTSIRVLGLD
jgi:NADPH-dependent F420 reductase